MLGPLLNRKSDLSVRNGVLLYKQLIHPMMDYACPAWRSAARTHVRKLKVLQSKIREDLGVPLFADIRALTASFDSKLADLGNLCIYVSHVRVLCRDLILLGPNFATRYFYAYNHIPLYI